MYWKTSGRYINVPQFVRARTGSDSATINMGGVVDQGDGVSSFESRDTEEVAELAKILGSLGWFSIERGGVTGTEWFNLAAIHRVSRSGVEQQGYIGSVRVFTVSKKEDVERLDAALMKST